MADFSQFSTLIVEDNEVTLSLLVSLAEKFGFNDVMAAGSAETGYEMFRAFKPGLVISDWQLQKESGLDLARRIRCNYNSPNQRVPIILLTAYSELQRAYEARDAGVDDFVVKPVEPDEFRRRLHRVLDQRRTFIEAPRYCGPDRRRLRNEQEEYRGPLKRIIDVAKGATTTLERQEAILRQIKATAYEYEASRQYAEAQPGAPGQSHRQSQ